MTDWQLTNFEALTNEGQSMMNDSRGLEANLHEIPE